ncbi:MAG: electron transfer flavoprotein subunit beta/FixA family protein [Chloroflexi bacterium]|nr:electron transfer flavoprotein subunit beta/FixA family protein [Chloroflexota bacterium]
MNIVVCLKQILDPEIPAQDFRIDQERKEPTQGNASLVISPFDENALEVALQMRERAGEGRVTAISIGSSSGTLALRKALAVKADQAVHVAAEGTINSFTAAAILGAALKKLEFDVVLCGRQAGDWDFGVVGPLLAESLGIPCVPFVTEASYAGGAIQAKRQTLDGYDLVKAPLPVVLTVTNASTNNLRYPKVKDVMMADRKEILAWEAATLLGGESPDASIEVRDLFIPVHKVECELIEGDNATEKALKLARRMRELKLV